MLATPPIVAVVAFVVRGVGGGRRLSATSHPDGAVLHGVDRGSITAETVIVLPTLLLVAALGVSAIGHVVDVMKATDAARAAARAAARGDDSTVVRQQAIAQTGSSDTVVTLTQASDRITVTVVTAGRSVLPGLAWSDARWPTAAATAVAAVEQP